MFKAVIFDLNGVILTEAEYFTQRLEKKYDISNKVFFKIFDEVIHIARQPGCQDFFALWQPKLEELGLAVTREEFFDLWFSGENLVVEFLDYIKDLRKAGIKVFILSNNFKERTNYYREHYPEIFDSVDGSYFSWETGFVKPDEAAYKNILAVNQLDAKDTIYFDDVGENIESAEKVGIQSYKFKDLAETKKVIASLK